MIGYVLSKFPVLSTTFILNELLELEAQGVALQVFSLAPCSDTIRHEDFARLRTPIHYVPRRIDRLARSHWSLLTSDPAAYRRGAGAAVRSRALWRFLQAGYVAREARRLGLTHLHAHFAHHPTTVAMLAAQLAGISYSFTAHAMDLFTGRNTAASLARKLAGARFVVTVSAHNVGYLREVAPGSGDKITLIRNGIDLRRFQPGSPPPPPFRVLCVARLVEKKGIPVLVEACKLLRDRGREVQCEIIGAGPLRRRLETQIRSHRLEDRVHLLGPASQAVVGRHYRSAHLFVLPCIVAADGDRDGLPVALTEALSAGLPVISTPVTGIPEVVRDGENGLLVPSGDAAALAGAIERLLDDEPLCRRLAANARPSVAADFDRRRTVAALRGLFELGDR